MSPSPRDHSLHSQVRRYPSVQRPFAISRVANFKFDRPQESLRRVHSTDRREVSVRPSAIPTQASLSTASRITWKQSDAPHKFEYGELKVGDITPCEIMPKDDGGNANQANG